MHTGKRKFVLKMQLSPHPASSSSKQQQQNDESQKISGIRSICLKYIQQSLRTVYEKRESPENRAGIVSPTRHSLLLKALHDLSRESS
jgi:hypothetical protein